jgi:hypothetical protein
LPEQERCPRCGILGEEGAVGQVGERGPAEALGPAVQTFPMQEDVDLAGGNELVVRAVRRAVEMQLEAKEIGAEAFGAGAMAGGEGNRLVEEEQRRIVALGVEDDAAAVFFSKRAADLGLAGVVSGDRAVRGMEIAAIAHQRSTGRRGFHMAEGRHAVAAGRALACLSGMGGLSSSVGLNGWGHGVALLAVDFYGILAWPRSGRAFSLRQAWLRPATAARGPGWR